MPVFERAGVSLYYEEFGSGYPLLLFAPGGMRSSIDFWRHSPFDPTAELAQDFRVIAMDQRNAGRSRAPISAADGWRLTPPTISPCSTISAPAARTCWAAVSGHRTAW